MKSPKNLKHTPIISVNGYDKFDAQFAGKTDVKALSIGKAQYDTAREQISLKVWRHTGKKWSRQSEELPIHRNLDLSILFLASLKCDVSSHYPQSILSEEIDNDTEVELIRNYYEKNKHFLKPRLKELKKLLENI